MKAGRRAEGKAERRPAEDEAELRAEAEGRGRTSARGTPATPIAKPRMASGFNGWE